MARYEYKCDNCEKIDLITMSIKEDIPKEIKCSKCGNKSKRIYTSAGTVYGCGGFYNTDYHGTI